MICAQTYGVSPDICAHFYLYKHRCAKEQFPQARVDREKVILRQRILSAAAFYRVARTRILSDKPVGETAVGGGAVRFRHLVTRQLGYDLAYAV